MAIVLRGVELEYEKLSQSPEVWAPLTSQLGWSDGQARTEPSADIKQKTEVPEENFQLAVRSIADFWRVRWCGGILRCL